jgi:hypothetical protein
VNASIAPQTLRGRLDAGERLIWWDRPRQGLMLRKVDAFAIPFSLLWAGFAIFWALLALKSGGPWLFKLSSVGFVLIGVYVVIGRFFHDAWRRQKLFYGLTDHRILIATPNSCRTLSLDHLNEIALEETGDGRGSIAFGSDPPWARLNTGWPFWTTAPAVPTLEGIAEARRVLASIREAQKRLGERQQAPAPA